MSGIFKPHGKECLEIHNRNKNKQKEVECKKMFMVVIE